MKKHLLKTLIVLGSLSGSLTANAVQQFDLWVSALNGCQNLDCTAFQIQRTPVPLNQLTPDEVRQMTEKVSELAENIWPDTILEGPYASDFKVHLENVEMMTINSAESMYRVTYAANAWNIDSCAYDPDDANSLKDCDQGSIVETAFISLDLSVAERDQSAFANFQPKN